MAEEQYVKQEAGHHEEVEVQERGLFDFIHHTKEDKKEQAEEIATGVEKIHISEEKEEKEEKKHDGLLEKLHRSSSSSSSSSSDEEVEVDGEKKKKKGLKDKLREKLGIDKKEEENNGTGAHDTEVNVKKVEDSATVVDTTQQEEKKGFFEKIKEKVLPGQKKPASDQDQFATPPSTPASTEQFNNEDENKGIFGKIMDKLPGYHKNDGNEEAKNTGVCH